MAILQAAGRGDLEDVIAIVQQDAGALRVQNASTGMTALFRAALYCRGPVVRYLLDADADIHHRARKGNTVLHAAAAGGDAGVASVLLERGADPTAVHSNGTTPLILAAGKGHDAVIDVLLEHGGSDVDAPGVHGKTALHSACTSGHDMVVRQLLKAGADATLRDEGGRTAMDHAAENGRHNCILTLQEWDRAYLLQRTRRVRDASSAPSSTIPQQGP